MAHFQAPPQLPQRYGAICLNFYENCACDSDNSMDGFFLKIQCTMPAHLLLLMARTWIL